MQFPFANLPYLFSLSKVSKNDEEPTKIQVSGENEVQKAEVFQVKKKFSAEIEKQQRKKRAEETQKQQILPNRKTKQKNPFAPPVSPPTKLSSLGQCGPTYHVDMT